MPQRRYGESGLKSGHADRVKAGRPTRFGRKGANVSPNSERFREQARGEPSRLVSMDEPAHLTLIAGPHHVIERRT